MASEMNGPGSAQPKTLVLCFDGTGNKFIGDGSDSNIVKIFHLLDREDRNSFHYYQPGIGTYVESGSLSHKSRFGRIKSWYVKTKDQAIGTSFGEHVMAGYKFLMRYYNDGDKIYFFGFSRGSYTARFLAQMLDYVGLLSAGNEEMLRFAWKTFARWQMRTEATELEKKKKEETFTFMKKFRETFSRPIVRLEFLGLFDCVNSVPQFETAWMNRTKFPYTAKTSAKVIRHAVSIDERRAKFRSDLMSENRDSKPGYAQFVDKVNQAARTAHDTLHHNGSHDLHHHDHAEKPKRPEFKKKESDAIFRPAQHPRRKSEHPAKPQFGDSLAPSVDPSVTSRVSVDSATPVGQLEEHDDDADYDDEEDKQDILELWFAGQHGDIGGGWPIKSEEGRPLSDVALMWMLREARRAGMKLDEQKLKASRFWFQERETAPAAGIAPALQIDGQPVSSPGAQPADADADSLYDEVRDIAHKGKVHDSLRFGAGLTAGAVFAWQIMEYMPFRRMDLQADGTWKPISWPLPRGETRDMKDDVLIHNSVIRRMEQDPTYRPGNLIVGGGGRGVRIAPQSYGMGKWKVAGGDGLLGEYYVKVKDPVEETEKQ